MLWCSDDVCVYLGECDNVFRSITGTWLASANGLFSGNIDFRYPEAKYSLEFQNFQVGREQVNG